MGISIKKLILIAVVRHIYRMVKELATGSGTITIDGNVENSAGVTALAQAQIKQKGRHPIRRSVALTIVRWRVISPMTGV